MPDIRYVCLSDMHLGAASSLLTNAGDPQQPSPILEELTSFLRFLISNNEKPEYPVLILNGDILEFALAEDHIASMSFERFVERTMLEDNRLFQELVYIPGNHDHHLWETARETQYANYLASSVGWGDYLPIPWHATNIFPNPPVPSNYLLTLIHRNPKLAPVKIQTAYPNFGIMGEDGSTCILFHHGHFIESIYTLVSTLKKMLYPEQALPDEVWDIEEENFAWIDFFWSTLGRSGAAGKGVGNIYEKLQYERPKNRLISNLAQGLADHFHTLPNNVEKILIEVLLKKISCMESNCEQQKLSIDAFEGLLSYIQGPLLKQVHGEIDWNTIHNVSFIFGHTHKPFQQSMAVNGYPGLVNVYNTGGWVIDSIERQPLHGGTVVLIDEGLNVVNLEIYRESDDPSQYKIRTLPFLNTNPDFYLKIDDLVHSYPFETFSQQIADAIRIIVQGLDLRVNSRVLV